MQCRYCGTELPRGVPYCPGCGAATSAGVSSDSASPYDPTVVSSSARNPYAVNPYAPPPPPGYGQAQSSLPQYPLGAAPRLDKRRRTVGATIVSVLLHLWGLFWFAFGLAGGVLHNAASTVVGLAFLVCCAAGALLLIPLLRVRKFLALGSWVKGAAEFGLTIAAVVLLAIMSSGPQMLLGSIVVVYGLAVCFVAFW